MAIQRRKEDRRAARDLRHEDRKDVRLTRKEMRRTDPDPVVAPHPPSLELRQLDATFLDLLEELGESRLVETEVGAARGHGVLLTKGM
jgi:hypothetical protein